MVLLWKAYFYLVRFAWYVGRRDFAGLHNAVRHHSYSSKSSTAEEIGRVCSAFDRACALYWKPVLCLQRSAATACLLRKYGVRAELVIGAQQSPFSCHAWVEVDGQVVNDKPYMRNIYAVLTRC